MAFTREFGKNNRYYHHDDRFSNDFPRRNSGNRRSRVFDLNHKPRKFVVNGGDVDMTLSDRNHSNSRFDPLKIERRIERLHSKRINKNLYVRNYRNYVGSPYHWFKVTLYHGRAYDRYGIISQLKNYVRPVLFTPFGTRLEDDNVVFFVDNNKYSIAIHQANLKLRMTDGSLMQIKVEPKMPIVDMTITLKENIDRVISSNYNDNTQHLDLSKFYANKDFIKQDLLAPLNRPNVALAVFQTMNENIPKLTSLNLSNNNIALTEHFSLLKNHANELKSIDLSKNRINNLNDLRCLEGLKLDSLVLYYNPLCDRFRDQQTYVREVRKIFPTLLCLDGVTLSTPNSHDDERTTSNTPLLKATATLTTSPAPSTSSQPNTPTNLDGEGFIRKFLELFYSMYDNPSGDRSALNDAYALTGEFSLTTSNFSGVDSNKFVTENRTLVRVINHLEGRTELLLIGKQNIVKFLSTLPKTQHDLSSFQVDLLVYTPGLISLRISGVFREAEYALSPIKAFNREFTLISNGTGFSIVKDALRVTEASTEQASTSFGSPTSNQQIADVSNLLKTSLSLNTETAPASPLVPSPSPSGISEDRSLMIVELSLSTGMNLLWSKKCLDETNWDLKKAHEVFAEFQKRNAIPAEAFVL